MQRHYPLKPLTPDLISRSSQRNESFNKKWW